MVTRYVIFARIYVGSPVSRWFPTISALLTSKSDLLEALMAGEVEGAIDSIESYDDIGDIARDVSEDIAIALGEPVRRRIAEAATASPTSCAISSTPTRPARFQCMRSSRPACGRTHDERPSRASEP